MLNAGGVVIRYGQLYGPGTYYETEQPPPPRIHVDEAARRTVPILDAPRASSNWSSQSSPTSHHHR